MTKHSFTRIVIATALLAVGSAFAADPAHWSLTPKPPMGWNSFDSYGDSVTESEFMANAQYMKDYLLQHGWNYAVIDYRWYDPLQSANKTLAKDAYGRLIPAPNRFPSAANGVGFKSIGDRIHAMGLKFGIHIMRGIARESVAANLPIEGSSYTAADAADTSSTCFWNSDMYGVRGDTPAGQAWYDSLFRQYAEWGVDFIKVDDLSLPYHAAEIEAIRRAIDKCGRPMVFSTSPGPTEIVNAEHVKANANMWRISGDFWPAWEQLRQAFDLARDWQVHADAGHWPDLDMIPIGQLAPRSPGFGTFTPDEERTVMTLWSIARSPLILGNNLTLSDARTLELMTNDEVIEANQNSINNKEYTRKIDQALIWTADVPGSSDKYVAIFNFRYGLNAFDLSESAARYVSGIISRDTPGYSVDVDVDITGATQLWLAVDNGGDHVYNDLADWDEPRLVRADGTEVKLTDIAWTSATASQTTPKVNKNANNGTMKINGRTLNYGIGMMPASIVQYDIPAGFVRFKARAGIDQAGVDNANKDTTGATARFFVYTQNPSETNANAGSRVSVRLKDIGITGPVTVRDLWAKQDIGTFDDGYLNPKIGWHGAGFYRIKVGDSGGGPGEPVVLPAPTALTATAGSGQATLNWAASTGATVYTVKRGTTSGGPYSILSNTVTGTSYTDAGLTNGTTYYYVVSAANSTTTSVDSNEASATPAAITPAPPVGLSATASSGQVNLNWGSVNGATSYNVKRSTTSGGSFSTVAADVNATAYTDTGLTNGTTYYYVASAKNGVMESANSTPVSATPTAPTTPPSGLAAPWATADIGVVTAAGSATGGGSTFTVAGSGADIWNSADGFRYVYQPVTGDCSITAYVSGLTNTDPWAKAGVMIRESLSASSTQVMSVVTVASGVQYGARTTTGGGTGGSAAGGFYPPYWVRVVREGNVFTSYRSPDGATWSRVGSTTIPMASSVYIGLAVTAHQTTGVLCTANFTNVTVTASNSGGTQTAPAAPASLTATASSGQVSLSWPASANATSYTVKRGATSGGPYTTLAANVTGTSYIDSGLTNGTPYYYVVSAVNSIGESTNSTQASGTPQVSAPGTPTSLSVTPGDKQAILSWTAASGATGYTVRRATSASGPFTVVASGVTGTTFTDTGLTNGTTYYYQVSASNAGGESALTAAVNVQPAAPSGDGLPEPWQSADIGNAYTPGEAATNGALFSVTGSGQDIWNSLDGFHFAYQVATGDCSIVARVTNVENTDPWAKAGVMIRENLTGGAAHMMGVITPSSGLQAGYRAKANNGTSGSALGGMAAPYWVRVTRVGDTFTVARSLDGTAWTNIITTTIVMPQTVYIGLVVTSHLKTGTLNTSTFSNVTATP